MTPEQSRMIEFNGDFVTINGLLSIRQFIDDEQVAGSRFVVVINDEVIPKSEWDVVHIEAGDKVEILSPISGG